MTKKRTNELSAEGEAKAQAWITQQREIKAAWQQVAFLARHEVEINLDSHAYLARALLDLRAKLEEHENKPAEDDVCPHGGC